MKNYERLPRKLKKIIKNNDIEKWFLFLTEKKASKERGEHLDKLFARDYKNAYKIFQRTVRHGK